MLNSTFRHLVTGLTLLQLGHAIPSSLATRATNQYLATFEDITPGLLASVEQPIGEYKNVFFQAFVLVKSGSNGLIESIPGVDGTVGGATASLPNVLIGIVPHSPVSSASFTTDSRIIEGTPSLMTIYPGSSHTKQITLFSFWWGVVLRSGQRLASLPINARLTVTGFDANNKTVAVDRFTFEVTSISQQMVFAEANPDFKNLTHVDFSVDGIAAGILFATAIDDVSFSVTQ